MIETALILAGGKGRRLADLTKDLIPKPLVEVAPGITMLDLAIMGLLGLGIRTIVISINHLGDQIQEYVERKYPGWHIDILREESALGTGGSINNFVTSGQNAPFTITPADNYLEWEMFQEYFRQADAFIASSLLYWATTIEPGSSQVPNNIWADAQTFRMVACTSGLSEPEKSRINFRYSQTGQHINLTSAGVVTVNPETFSEETKRLPAPYCIYKDLVPRWALEGKSIFVGIADGPTEVLDMGTPERLIAAKERLDKQLAVVA